MTVDRCIGGQKHDWRKVGAIYDRQGGLRPTKRRCLRCGHEQSLVDDRTQDEIDEDNHFVRGD